MPSQSSSKLASYFYGIANTGPVPTREDFPMGWRVPASAKGRRELMMWKKWKDGGERPEDMEPLLASLQPLINKRLSQFSGVPIQRETLRAEANNKVISSLRTFDPRMSQMNTYLTHALKGMRRYVVQHQNMTRIVEDRATKIGEYNRTKATLVEELGREPTAMEIADKMMVPVTTVTRLQMEYREDLLASGASEDPFINETPRSREVLRLIIYELTPTEMQVYEYLVGYGGKPKITKPGEIAKQLGWSGSKVSQVKNSIAEKMKKYL